MCHTINRKCIRRRNVYRRGMTLVELLIASAMLLLLAGVIGGLASAVQTSSHYSQGHADATQHARVALERMTREINRATATGNHAGMAVLSETVGGVMYPDTLLVWSPVGGTPSNPNGPPLISELVIYCPDPAQPENLLEIRAPADSRTIPLDATVHQSPWPETIAAIKADVQSQRVVLTNLLRVANTTGGALASSRRGVVRFVHELAPGDDELSAFRSGTGSWADLPWPQGLYGSQTGLRQSRLRIELQLVPGEASRTDTTGQQAVPYFGSAAIYYPISP